MDFTPSAGSVGNLEEPSQHCNFVLCFVVVFFKLNMNFITAVLLLLFYMNVFPDLSHFIHDMYLNKMPFSVMNQTPASALLSKDI